jgi:precorrin-6B methylase 2
MLKRLLGSITARVAVFLKRIRQFFIGPVLHANQVQREELLSEIYRLREEHRAAREQLDGAIRETDRLLVALVQAKHTREQTPALPVTLGEHRILAAHPVLPFIYLDTRDVRLTPRLLLGLEGEPLVPVLERHVRPGAIVVEVGAGQGYLTLALAAAVGSGRVVAYEPDPMRFAMLQDNLTAHDLHDRVELRPSAIRHVDDLDGLVENPALVRIAATSAVDVVLDALERRRDAMPALLVRWAGDAAVLERLTQHGRDVWHVCAGGKLLPTEADTLREVDGPVDVLVLETAVARQAA